jgi:hypothetical protein
MKTDTPRTDKIHSGKDKEFRDNLTQYRFMHAHADTIEKELAAVTEQRDGLKQAVDCASDLLASVTEQRDEIHKDFMCLAELLDGHDATECRMNLVRLKEQRDRLSEALWNMLNQEHGSAIKAGILLRSLNLQHLNPNTPDQERKSPASDGSKFNNQPNKQ